MPDIDLTALFQEFDHTARIEDSRLYVERNRSPAKRISTKLKLMPGHHWIFCGSIGSGKSSELAFLGHLLKEEYFVIGLDLYQSVDDVTTIRPAEVLMLIGAAAVRTVQEWYGGHLPDDLVDDLRSAFMGVLENRPRTPEPSRVLEGVALLTWAAGTGDLGAAGTGLTKIAGSMGSLLKGKQRTQLGGLTRPSLREGDPDIVALLDATNAILDQIQNEYDKMPVILVDGLDRLDSMETIRPLFCARLLSDVRGSSIYSAPITMMLQTEWAVAAAYFERERLTNVVVTMPERGGLEESRIAAGRELMREVVTKRLARHGLEEEHLFEEGALDEIITESGGVFRTLVHLVQVSILEAFSDGAEIISKRTAQAAIHELAQEFEITMTRKRRTELESISEFGEPSGDDTALELLLGNYVLPYRNGHSWWAPAPLVARILQ